MAEQAFESETRKFLLEDSGSSLELSDEPKTDNDEKLIHQQVLEKKRKRQPWKKGGEGSSQGKTPACEDGDTDTGGG